ncbi:uncharacterized protein F4807DRAFT_460242 [Annulohypoxylon truncatum]|uniref:uncharacterized protein n=1 Tax=Annulohypoxylon truncatum TaxID=327061 RepID=UPI0020085179|nr:uncharacterized protein F4807DRAFT_460242 [Annulohypoxylon truncatum]KAI1209951.1 hypothetical protein F4807DRAFT_460242 [Annulohypoxylon truncatum]
MFPFASNLQRHVEGRDHKAKANGQAKPPSTRALKERSAVEKNRQLQKYFCHVCRVPFNIKGHLDKHMMSKGRRAKADTAEAAADPSEHLAAVTFTCTTSNMKFDSATKIKRHNNGRGHRAKVAVAEGGKAKQPTARALMEGAAVEKNRAYKKYFCRACNWAFNIKGHLDKHLRS